MASRNQISKSPGQLSTPPPSVAQNRTPTSNGKTPSMVMKNLSAVMRSPSFSFNLSFSKNNNDEGENHEDDVTEDNFEEVSSLLQKQQSKASGGVTMITNISLLLLVAALGIYACATAVAPVWRQQGQRAAFVSVPGDETRSCPVLEAVKYPDEEKVNRHYANPTNYSRAECTCTPVHNFVILSMQRSGSGWFETLLNNHPNISSHGEIFSVRPRRTNFSTIAHTLDSIYNLDWVNSAAKNSCTAAVGLKWMLNQGAMEYHREVENFFQTRHVSVILLLRRNLLKRLISILANAYDRKMKLLGGKHKSHVHSEEEAKRLAEFRPTLNTKHLAGNLQRVQEMADDALRVFNGTRMTVVYYEDVAKDRSILTKVQDFLGVEKRELTSKQVKIHTKLLSEQVENWAEVEKTLKGTEFEKFLEESES